MNAKTCANCGATLVQRENEYPSKFEKRKTCGHACRMVCLRKVLLERGAMRRTVRCMHCGRRIVRCGYNRAYSCSDCNNKTREIAAGAYRRRLRENDRRYRIIMTALGFDEFRELMEFLKDVPWANVDGRRVRDLRCTG